MLDYDAMLADPELEAVIVATSDAFHVPASIRALAAGKHVLCEKPIGVSVEEVEELAAAVKASGKVLQVGHMKRFDPGLEAARDFVRDEMGEVLALKAWYCDSTHRYTMTDAVQPLPVLSAGAKKPRDNPKADLRRYFMLAHGSHLVDTARFLGGDIVEVSARLTRKVRRLLLVRRNRLRQWRARPSRPDRRGAHGLARGPAALRRERQRHREDLQPLVLQGFRGRHLLREGRHVAPAARAPTGISIGASSKALPTPSSTARRCAAPISTTASPRSAPWRRSRESVRSGRPVAPRRCAGAGLMQIGIFAKTFAGNRRARLAGGRASRRI